MAISLKGNNESTYSDDVTISGDLSAAAGTFSNKLGVKTSAITGLDANQVFAVGESAGTSRPIGLFYSSDSAYQGSGVRVQHRNTTNQSANHFEGVFGTTTNFRVAVGGDVFIHEDSTTKPNWKFLQGTNISRLRGWNNANLITFSLDTNGVLDLYSPNAGNDFMFRMFSNVGGTKVEKFKFETGGNAYKPSGGSWASLSDARSKTVLSPYASGLAELKQVEPVRYKYNGLEQEYVGIVAQQVETVMPELVSVSSGKTYSGEEFSDLRSVDQTPLTFALINAVKEMAARIEALEAEAQALKGGN